ncbi:GIY-YIG nuclease family protein [Streptococcus pneumoniae]
METKAYMYVLECADGSLYTGYTTDLDKRIKIHNSGKGAKYTRARLPVKLLYYEEFSNKPSAMSAESRFKRKKRQQKLEYIRLKDTKTPPISDIK